MACGIIKITNLALIKMKTFEYIAVNEQGERINIRVKDYSLILATKQANQIAKNKGYVIVY